MDKNIFFRKATLLICSSLDIEVALGRCLEFLSQYIPADIITLNIYNPDTKSVRYLAKASHTACEKLKLDIKLPRNIIRSIESGKRFKNDQLVVNHPSDDPLGKIITTSLGIDHASIVALRLVIEGHRLGVADLFTFKKGGFTAEHGRLFALLRDPFAIALANAIKHQKTLELKDQLASDNKNLNRKLFSSVIGEVVGSDSGLKNVMLMVNQVARLNNTVLLLGETGVGKEIIANTIHHSSQRKNGPFIKVNCGAIPESLIDSELFGHEKGAFTGAISEKRGLFERAHQGTIFLDEIGELPLQAQVRLLRVLQTHEIERVGGTTSIPLDIRVIAATHQNLDNMVREGRFREDLFFRINVFPIQIPPLRQRKEDIPAFVQYFSTRKSEELGIMPQSMDSSIEMGPLLDYDWPGNVRELGNVVERALIQQRSEPIFSRLHDSKHNKIILPNESGEFTENHLPLDDAIFRHIQKILEMTNGKINGPKGAAALLHLHPSTLRNKMNKLGIPYGRDFKKTE